MTVPTMYQIVEAFYAVPAHLRQHMTWVVDEQIMRRIREVNGEYVYKLWEPLYLLGRPVRFEPDADLRVEFTHVRRHRHKNRHLRKPATNTLRLSG